MRYSFTGPHKLSLPDYGVASILVRGALSALDPTPTEIHTGGAHGIDTIVAFEAWKLWRNDPDVRLHLWYPQGEEWNHKCADWVHEVHAVQGGYMRRNDFLVRVCQALCALPRTRVEPTNPRAGGGTWATVRRARKADRELRFFPLDRSAPWTESTS